MVAELLYEWGGITYQERIERKIIDGNLNETMYRDEFLAPLVLLFTSTCNCNK